MRYCSWFLVFFVALFFSSLSNLSAQSRITVSGQVVDSLTREHMEFITIQEKGTTNGTITNTDGHFSLQVKPGATIIFSCVGYEAKSITVGKKSQQLTAEIVSINKQLSEVIVKPKRERYRRKDNPSVALAKKVIEHKLDNSVYDHDYYSRDRYDRLTYSFNNFDEGMQKMWKKKFKFIENYVDTALLSGCPVLAVSSQEKVETQYFRKSTNTKKTVVEGFKSVGMEDMMPTGIVEAIKTEIFPEIDILEGDVYIYSNKFVSPLSTFAPSFYKFYILDTVRLDDGESYIDLGFAPLAPQSFGFIGHLYITNDSSYFVRKALLNIPPDINLNFVRNMRIAIENERLEDGTRYTKSQVFDSEINFTEGTLGLYAHRECWYNNLNFEAPQDTTVFNKWGPSFDSPNINKRSEAFWDPYRANATYDRNKTVEALLADMRTVPLFYYGERVLTMLFKGFVPLGNKPYEENKWLYGPLNATASYNSFEGLRLRAGGLSTANFNRHLFLYGYAAYGTKDKKLKYDASVEYSFKPKKMHANEFPIHSLKLDYWYDTKLLGQDPTNGKDNFLLSVKRSDDEQITYERVLDLTYTQELWSGFSWKLSARNSREYATRYTAFERVGDGAFVPHYDMSTATLTLRYAPHETFIQSRTSRTAINHEHPIYVLTHTVAKAGVLGSEFDYQRTDFKFTKRFWMSPFGYVDTNLKAGKVWSQSPFTMLCLPNANLGYTIQEESFSQMNAMEFVNDQYVGWDLVYYLNGCLFNNIPLLKKLKWREVVSYRGIIGKLTDKNDPSALNEDGSYRNPDLYKFPSLGTVYKMGNQPYMEFAVGIENIFRCFRVDYIRRLSYLEHPNVSKNGVQVTMHWTF